MYIFVCILIINGKIVIYNYFVTQNTSKHNY